MRSPRLALCFIAPLLASSLATAADALSYKSEQLDVQLEPRTPQQMAAFYEARGFSREMIDSLDTHCFITVAIHNKSTDVIWLDLNQWQFRNAEGVVLRQDRTYWHERWTRMQIPLAHQSTFRWTLLPEQLDFRPNEYEGGNITLPRLGKPMTIIAQFYPDEQRNGTPIEVKFDNVHCAENP